MAIDADLVEQLEQFGLTETEAAAYLALVSYGRAKPSELALEADISTSYAYQIAEGLERKGLAVVKDQQTPTTIQAKPPTESLGSRMNRMEQTLSAVQDQFSRPPTDAGSLETHRSRETVLNRLRNQIENVEAELFLSLPYETMLEITDVLRNAVDRGVFVLLAVTDDGESSEADLNGIATAVRMRQWGTNIYLATDTSQGLLAPCSVLNWDRCDSEAVSFNHFTIATAIKRAFFGTIWCNATETMLRRPREERRTYRTIRPAVYDATIRLRSGKTVRTDLRAHPTLSDGVVTGSGGNHPPWNDGTERRISGSVVETRQNLVDPPTSDFALEHGLVVETDEGRITVGGRGAFIGDYIAEEITLLEG